MTSHKPRPKTSSEIAELIGGKDRHKFEAAVRRAIRAAVQSHAPKKSKKRQ